MRLFLSCLVLLILTLEENVLSASTRNVCAPDILLKCRPVKQTRFNGRIVLFKRSVWLAFQDKVCRGRVQNSRHGYKEGNCSLLNVPRNFYNCIIAGVGMLTVQLSV